MQSRNSGMAVASFVLGLCGLFLGWIPFFGQVIFILAIVFGFVALNQIKRDKKLQGKALAVWGIVLGFFWIALFIILVSVGIGWTVFNGAGLSSSTNSAIRDASLCLDSDLIPVNVSLGGNGLYYVTLESKSRIEDFDFGAIIVFYNEFETSAPIDFGSFLSSSEEKTNLLDAGIDADKIEVTPYFLNDEGKKFLCSTTREFYF